MLLFIYNDMKSVQHKKQYSNIYGNKTLQTVWWDMSSGYSIGRQRCTSHTTESSGFIKQPILYFQQKLVQ
jgi:hypothetical protein